MQYTFDHFALDTRRLTLTRDGAPLPVEPQVFALLQYLIENRDRVVLRDEIFQVIWQDRAVSDAALSSRIKSARAALGDSGSRQSFVRTAHGRGFQFVAPVRVEDTAPNGAVQPPSMMLSRPRLALLPVAMLNPSPEHQAFGEGLAHDIETGLSRVRALYVAHNPSEPDPRRVASDLGVGYLVSIRMRFVGDSYRLTASLLRAEQMEEVWADQFSGQIEDPFTAQDRLTSAVLGALVPNIMLVEICRAVSQAAPEGAYATLLRAIPLCWSGAKDDNMQATEHLESAIRSDPDHAMSHALLSWCMAQRYLYRWGDDPDAAHDVARDHWTRALVLAPMDTLVLTFVGGAQSTARHYAEARHNLEKALELDPHFAWAWGMLGFVYAYTGASEQGLDAFERAFRASPHDPIRASYFFGFGHCHYALGDFRTALTFFEKVLIENPRSFWGPRMIAACAAELGDVEKVAWAVSDIRVKTPEATAAWIAKNAFCVENGLRARLQSSLEKAGI